MNVLERFVTTFLKMFRHFFQFKQYWIRQRELKPIANDSVDQNPDNYHSIIRDYSNL